MWTNKQFVLIYLVLYDVQSLTTFSKVELNTYKQRVSQMFYHAYNGYLKYAYPYDELRPITCDGHDTWGSYSLTLVDALDTLAVMGNYSEFRRVAHLLVRSLDFDQDINVSVFETNIRIVGGLLSAHLMSKRAGMVLEDGWPCSGKLLRMAEKVARKLIPAFETPTGMPYGTVNLLYGVPDGETPITCTSGVTTFLVEFGALSRLTGDPVFENVAMKAMDAMWKRKSEIGLVGNHIDVLTGKWTALDSGIGAGVDSYFEYLVKGGILFQKPELIEMFRGYEKSIEKYLKKEDWYMWAHMQKGTVTLPVFQSLDAFWPGMQSLLGDIDKAMQTVHNYHQVWSQFGFTPEFYNIPSSAPQNGREGYPLRPELIESLMYLYRATRDPTILQMGVDILESIEHSAKTRCGYATIKDVKDHKLENRMESFFLAETTKYLYLLFDQDNFIHNTGDHGTLVQTPSGSCIIDAGGYVFNTEAHPIDPAALYCCSAEKHKHDIDLFNLHDNIDLLTLFDLNDQKDNIFEKTGKQMDKLLKKDQDASYKSIFDSTLSVVTGDNVNGNQPEGTGAKTHTVVDNSAVNIQGTNLQNVVESIEKAAETQTESVQESLTQTLDVLKKLVKEDSVVSPPLSVLVPNTQETTSQSNQPKLDSTKLRSTDSTEESEQPKLDSTKLRSPDLTVYSNQPKLDSTTLHSTDSVDQSDSVNSQSDGYSEPQESAASPTVDIHSKFQYEIDTTRTHLLTCPAQPYHARFSLMGEMFVEK